MAKKRKKRKNSIFMTVLITVLSLTVVTFLVVVCAFFAKLSDADQEESYVGSDVLNEIATENISVKINMESCTMTVGTKIRVSATIYPNGSSAGIMWTSSNPEVFTVDAQGNLEVLDEGIVALTANFGEVCDSIAIECVKNEGEGMLNLPRYDMFVSEQETTKAAEESTKANRENETTVAETTSSQNQTRPTSPTVTPTTATQQETTTKRREEETTLYTLETTTEYEGNKVLSTEIAKKLEGYGFKKYLDNTYVFEENNTYSGEVIITSNMTHIYIKERSDAFDVAILSVLTELLPDSHNEIWNMYKSTATDQTVMVDGRVVRVVVPGDTGHSQLVIYN